MEVMFLIKIYILIKIYSVHKKVDNMRENGNYGWRWAGIKSNTGSNGNYLHKQSILKKKNYLQKPKMEKTWCVT